MKLGIINPQKRLHLVSAVILVVGLGSAVLIYLTAEKDSESVLGYEAAGGYVYPIMPEDSKKYIHDMELYGGKANVLANEFVRWFAGLWRGKSLAFTVGLITLIVSSVVFFVANHRPSDSGSDSRDEPNRA